MYAYSFLLPLLAATATIAQPFGEHNNGWGSGKAEENHGWGQPNRDGRGGNHGGWRGGHDTVTAHTITTDLHAIDTAVYQFRKGLKQENGQHGWDQGAQAPEFGWMQYAYRKCYNDMNQRKNNFTTTDSTMIVNYAQQSIGKDMPSAMEELKSHKDDFVKSNDQGAISMHLMSLMEDHDKCAKSMMKKLTLDIVAASSMVNKIHSSIQSCIDHYKS